MNSSDIQIEFQEPRFKGLLFDLDGVLYVGDRVIDGARETLDFLNHRCYPHRFITNTTTKTPTELVEKIEEIGLPIKAEEIFTPVSATILYLSQRGTPSCHLLLRDSIKPLFNEFPKDDERPDYVIIGDIGASWNYDNLNSVFNMLMRGSKLICMHRNKFWQGEEGLRMDIGAFVAALEYVSDSQAMTIGKPSASFFQLALESLNIDRSETAIIGDDIDSDIGGGQRNGLGGILVKTGKYREAYVKASSIKPDYMINSIANLSELVFGRSIQLPKT